jgi:steroid 17alpha-monooxygenase/17alpha-hydroxyprogesterone aldolase
MTMAEVFMAGMETTASTLCWALLYLIHNPNVQQKLHQELDQVIGPDRLPKLVDKKHLPYLEATITDTLRISSLLSLAFPHKTTVDTTLQGYSIPKGTTVLTNLWSLHHDPEIWDDPNEFRPRRFLNEGGNFVPPKAERFLPFLAGRRGCLGESLARIEVFLVLARLLHSFKFKNPPGSDLPSLKPITGLALMPRPFCVCAINRHSV